MGGEWPSPIITLNEANEENKSGDDEVLCTARQDKKDNPNPGEDKDSKEQKSRTSLEGGCQAPEPPEQ